MSAVYESMADDELRTLAMAGRMSAELELRHRRLRVVETTVYVCLRCGECIGRDIETVDRITGEPWRDPFKPANVKAWYENLHSSKCPKNGWLRLRRPRTAVVCLTTPA